MKNATPIQTGPETVRAATKPASSSSTQTDAIRPRRSNRSPSRMAGGISRVVASNQPVAKGARKSSTAKDHMATPSMAHLLGKAQLSGIASKARMKMALAVSIMTQTPAIV